MPGRKKPRTGDRRDERCPKPPGGRFTSFTLLNAPLDQVLMQIKDEGTLTFLGKLKSDPSKRSRNKYCRFHRDHGHDTADCYDLKQQIRPLLEKESCRSLSARREWIQIFKSRPSDETMSIRNPPLET